MFVINPSKVVLARLTVFKCPLGPAPFSGGSPIPRSRCQTLTLDAHTFALTPQAAAGAYAYLRDNVAIKANPDLATPDVSIECAGMLERLMLAQVRTLPFC